MFANLFRQAKSWLHRKPTKPLALIALEGALADQIKRRGPGSDLAAAKLEGIRIAQLVQNRAIGWRGSR